MVCDSHGGILQGFWIRNQRVQNLARSNRDLKKQRSLCGRVRGYDYCWMTVRGMNSLTVIITVFFLSFFLKKNEFSYGILNGISPRL